MSSTPNLAICGAGMAGIAAAYHLTVKHGIKDLLLIDELPPLSLTSNKGTQAYRNWWPGPDDTMVKFISRSIDLLEEAAHRSDNCFHLNRRGYVYLTADKSQIPAIRKIALNIARLGAGTLRENARTYRPAPAEGFDNLPDGADLIVEPELIFQQFPFLAEDVVAMLHIRRAGFLDVQLLADWLLNQIKNHGGRIVQDKVIAVSVANNRIDRVHLQSGETISPGALVIAAGPYLKAVAAMMALDIPVKLELHSKIALPDHLGLVPASAPLMIWNDPLYLPWTDEEKSKFSAQAETAWLLKEFPAGVHFRPRVTDGKLELVIIWTYEAKRQEQPTPPEFNPFYGEILLRALSRMIPALSAYFGQGDRAYVDGGYYCKTVENRPLIGPLPIERAYVVGALSGFGIMGSQAAGELIAAHITGATLPTYAPMLSWERYQDPNYQALMKALDDQTGQL